MIKTALFDIDGVIIRHKKSFAETLDQNIYRDSNNTLNLFYKSDINKNCDRGVRDPIIEIQPFLRKIGWLETCESYLQKQYNFETGYIDCELLKEIAVINKSLKCYIASNQNYLRKKFLMEKLQIEQRFSGAFFSSDCGYIKPENEYWDYTFTGLKKYFGNLKKSEVLFFDDMKENIDSANLYGYKTVHVCTEEDLTRGLNMVKTAIT